MEVKKLSFEEMAREQAGMSFGCGVAIASYAAAWGGLIFFSGGTAAAALAVTGLYGGALGLISCAE